jgi:hypothetical protein
VMNKEIVFREFESLPPEAQKQVLDFISFLQTRYKTASGKRKSKPTPKLSEEAFIGMWRNRTDMCDSNSWVRKNRKSEWG